MLFTPIPNATFDLTTVTLISALIILSVLSLCFIFHLRLKSKSLTYLQGFNSLWTVRFLLVLFISLWAITELLRLPFWSTRQHGLCKIHIVLSLGFSEPAFLVTLLYLLNASIKNKTPDETWAITRVLLTCLPLAVLQGFLVFFDPLENHMPSLLWETSVVIGNGNDTVLCTYPFINSVVFAAFAAAYSAWFLFSCWRVLSLVINKGLRLRIYGLASVVVVALPLQVVSLAFTVLWSPDQGLYSVVSLFVFLGAFCCAAVGEGILVIKPISDALDAGGSCCQWNPRDAERQTKGSAPPETVAVDVGRGW